MTLRLIELYDEEEYAKLESFIDHDRDYLFTYAGLRQVVDKYLVQDRSTGSVHETPQFMYLLIAASIFSKYPKENRLDYVKSITMPFPDIRSTSNTNHGGSQNTPSAVCVLRSG